MKLPSFSFFGKPWVLLSLAALLGLVATVMTVGYIRAKERQAVARVTATQGKVVKVVVPKYNMTKGTRVTWDNMSLRSVPSYLINNLSITPDNFASYIGREIGYDLSAGTPLTRALMRFGGAKDFSGTLPEKMRALTIKVDQINSISGMLRPGDRIDLFVKMKIDGGDDVVFALLTNVSVKATGQIVEGEDSGAGGQGSRSYNTATLEVTPKNAQRLILAQASGKITATLRNPNDYGEPSLGRMTKTSLTGGGGGFAEVDSGPMNMIRYFVGGSPVNGAPKVVAMPVMGVSAPSDDEESDDDTPDDAETDDTGDLYE